jgi:serine/threonine protein kinase
MNNQNFQLLLPEPTMPKGSGWMALGPDGTHVTVRMGHPPLVPSGLHPSIATIVGTGEWNGEPCWIETRAGKLTLADLPRPLSETDTAHLIACVADGLSSLHSKGFTHGKLVPENVTIGQNGIPMMIGCGVEESSAKQDIEAATTLIKYLCSQSLEHRAGSAAELAASLREVIVQAGNPPSYLVTKAIEIPNQNYPLEETVCIQIQPQGYVDEVQHDIGPDSKNRGLLDRWSNSSSMEDFTDDQTDAIDPSDMAHQARLALIAELNHQFGQSSRTNTKTRSVASRSRAIQNLVQREPPDPLPTPDGIPHELIHNPQGETERTAEIPLDAHPERTNPPDNTGNIQTSSEPLPFRTTLINATVMGMLGAVIAVTITLFILNQLNG